MDTALIWDGRYGDHDIGKQKYVIDQDIEMTSGLAFENPSRLNLIYELLEKSGFSEKMIKYPPEHAIESDLLKVHTKEMVEKVKQASKNDANTEVGEAAVTSFGSYEIALLSAGGAKKAVDVVFTEENIKQSFALIRPPGHHATRNSPMGFCLFNNVAIAVEHAKATYGIERMLVLDWDVHHGNGTQDIFYEDPSVLFVSIHQDKNYPLYGGEISETGKFQGEGFNINIPLIPGCGDEEYLRVIDEIIAPAVEFFNPELILISAGQDANIYDPLSRMMVTRNGFKLMTKKMKELAAIYSNHRLVVIQEGGYSLPYLPLATFGVIEGLLDEDYKWEADIEKLLPFNDFHPNIDSILGEVKRTFPKIYKGMSIT
ncbi:class II histone deacetylase [Aneurinibacillus aneurinilyticus]|jgi:acetoin utilization deacetylase AcuC-like enzyme|uniref:class II histone deacetylase n=1 Tax=Aneurinibacillus aneurinilyticus TaxID=1391 RepID=UPI0023F22FCC|nr:class II histone deacetylase [Aneurinibacillus aneurinilyticus]MCI1696007.1 class II histone deacetylase [Aneurinibacillus aneurinilyticus]